MRFVLKLAEKGLLPDFILRAGIRHLSKVRLKEITSDDCELGAINETAFISAMNKSEVAPVPELANAQHYEVPEQFFHYCLGKLPLLLHELALQNRRHLNPLFQ